MAKRDQAAVIIGAAQGIGHACVESLLKSGVKVVFGDVNDKLGRKAERSLCDKYGEGQAVFKHCDVTKDEDVEGLVSLCLQRFGRLDIFSPVAAIVEEGDEWRKAVALNLVAVISSTYVVMKHMSKEHGGKGGVIVFIASAAGLRPTHGVTPVYTATKHGVIGFMRDWAAEPCYETTGIRFGAVCPTMADTPFVEGLAERSRFPEIQRQRLACTEKLQASEVADAFMRLVQEPDLRGEALYVTKQDGKSSTTVVQFPTL